MAQTHNNPDSMERFAYELERFIDGIQEALNKINGSYAALGEDWQDNKRAEFDESMMEISNTISRFSDYANESIRYLHRQITILREYENNIR